MKRDLVDMLACPVCKGDLRLEVSEERGDEVLTGVLTCSACRQSYPIEQGIPNLLPPRAASGR